MEATTERNASRENLSPLFIPYGGRRAPLFLFVVAMQMVAAALLGWLMSSLLFVWLFAIFAAFLLISALITRRVTIFPGEGAIRVDWVFAQRIPLHSRSRLLAPRDSLLVWRAHVPESESGYGTINVIFKPAEGRDVPVQVYDIRKPDFSCPEAEYLVAQVIELTGLPVEERVATASGLRP